MTVEPRKRLDHEQVLVAAEALVDRTGWPHLTMSELARELGVAVPSLYRHVRNLDGLLGELQNRTITRLGTKLNRAAMGRSAEAGIRALAATLREFAREHPNRYDLAMRRAIDSDGFASASIGAAAALDAIVRSYGIDDPPLETQVSTFAALHGVIVLENSGFFPSAIDADVVYAQVLDQVVDLLASAVPDELRAG
jgi:AcrR family transcriptional regulator